MFANQPRSSSHSVPCDHLDYDSIWNGAIYNTWIAGLQTYPDRENDWHSGIRRRLYSWRYSHFSPFLHSPLRKSSSHSVPCDHLDYDSIWNGAIYNTWIAGLQTFPQQYPDRENDWHSGIRRRLYSWRYSHFSPFLHSPLK
jgi:hypothetical protein